MMIELFISAIVVFQAVHSFHCDVEGCDYIKKARRTCRNDYHCGAVFNDYSGYLEDFIEFEVEYLFEGAGFDGSVWVPDKKYPKYGYLLFVLLGPPEISGLYKFLEDKYGRIYSEKVLLVESSADVAWSSATPDYAYISSLGGQKIVVVNLKERTVELTYEYFEGKQFAGPDGIYADDYGNVYFTDTDYNVVDSDPTTTREGGGLFRIDVLSGEIYLEATTSYGYNGIAINNIYGNGKRLVASNTVDLPDYIYQIDDNTQQDVYKIYIAEYLKRKDGSLRDRGMYYPIIDDIDAFPKKPFLDGMTFDRYDNLYVSVIINQTMSKLVVLNYDDDCSDRSNGYTDYIGEIIFKEGYAINAITLAGDGYFYCSLVNFPDFTQGQFVRFKAKRKSSKRSSDSSDDDSSDKRSASSDSRSASSSESESESESRSRSRYQSPSESSSKSESRNTSTRDRERSHDDHDREDSEQYEQDHGHIHRR